MYGPKKLKKCLQLGEISHLVRLPFCVSSPMSLLRSTAGTGSEIGHYPSPHRPSSVITPARSARRANVRAMRSAAISRPRGAPQQDRRGSPGQHAPGRGWRRACPGTIEAGRRRRIARGRRPDVVGGETTAARAQRGRSRPRQSPKPSRPPRSGSRISRPPQTSCRRWPPS